MCIGLGGCGVSGESRSSCSCVANGVTGYTTVGFSSLSSSSSGGVDRPGEDDSEEAENEGEGTADSSSE